MKEPKLVSIFPYQIKDVNKFYDRAHPKNLHPTSSPFQNYWKKFRTKCVEGHWINDKGTWVFMMPKLFFYTNYTKISTDDNRSFQEPRLRDNEWIMASYFLCLDGFSGFEEDYEYTCHDFIRRIEEAAVVKTSDLLKDPLNEIELSHIPTSCFKSDGTYKKYVDPWEYLTHFYLVDKPAGRPLGQALYENTRYNGMMLTARGIGKAIHPDELVRVKNGWTKINDLIVGDQVYGGDGRLTNVTGVYKDQKGLNFYKVKLRDGREIEVCEDHLWKVWNKDLVSDTPGGPRGAYEVKSTKELFKDYRNSRIDSQHFKKYGEEKSMYEYKYSLPIADCLNSESEKELPIHPYVLGCLIGDGSMSTDAVSLTTGDLEIAERFGELLPKEYRLTKQSGKLRYGIVAKTWRSSQRFSKLLEPLGLARKKSEDKSIPDSYLFTSEENRLELLKGLMDTDGCSYNGNLEYYTVSKKLCDNFLDLVRSLGIAASVSVKTTGYISKKTNEKVTCKDCYVVRMFTDKPIFSLKRKLGYLDHTKSKNGTNRYSRVKIVEITPIGKSDGVCITVDNHDHTYITKDYIVTHNSLFTFVGDFLHEWLFNGIHRIADIHRVNDKLLFGMGASNKDYIDRSLANVSTLYDRLPGGYRYSDAKKQRYMGAFYKRIKGSWRSDAETTHSVKYKSGRDFIESSTLYVAVLTSDKTKIGAGDRFRRIYIEEVGFLEYLFDVHSANTDSMIAEGVKVGSAIYTGTGGAMDKIREAKKMFDTVKAYGIFGIPNYWENVNKKIGLFIPAHYVNKAYKDENGNTKLELVHKALLKQREEDRLDLDSRSFEERISFNPMEPKEILKANSGGILPRKECQDQLSDLDTYDIFRKKAQIGSFKFNPVDPRGVEWVKDMDRLLHPILDMDQDTSASNKDGAWIIYEQPPDYIPHGLYWLIYDPAKKDGDGESYHSFLMYKSFYVGNEKSLYDTVVAELICRRGTLEANYQEGIKGAKYFNAKIFPETNIIGFVNWCKNNGFYNMLEGDAAWVEEQASPGSKRNYYRVGIEMTDRKKQWAMKALRDYLLSIKEHDPHTGAPMIRTLDWIFSKRLLSEIINYEDGLNFDHVSSALCLMFLREKLHGVPPAELEDEDEFQETSDQRYIRLQLERAISTERTSRRSKFVMY